MKQHWVFTIFGAALALLCFSCTGFFEIEGVEKITPYDNPEAVPTYIIFNNSANKYAVDVFSSYTRNSPIISVPSYGRSNNLSWVATGADGYDFYLIYNFMFEGNKIPYIPTIDSPVYFINVRINRGQTNTVSIPSLSTYINPDTRLSNDIWLLIKNTGTSQLRLISGSSILSNENNETTVAQNGGSGLYKLSPTASPSSYKILVGSTETALPLTIFNPGSVHEIIFNGSTATPGEKTELTLNSL
jgi:hypothetical protein